MLIKYLVWIWSFFGLYFDFQAAWYDFNEEKPDGDSKKETDNVSMMVSF
jgi:hypothetical protein